MSLDFSSITLRELSKSETLFLEKLVYNLPCHTSNPYGLERIYDSYWFCEHIEIPTKKTIIYYAPEATDEQLKNGMVTINAETKKGLTGKRIEVKIGKFLSKFPIRDVSKERVLNEILEEYQEFDASVIKFAKDGFERIVTMETGNQANFTTTYFEKHLMNSCMRYSAEYFDLSHHPYTVYESGEFTLAYVQEYDCLLARVLVHEPSKTYSAIYSTKKSIINGIHTKLKEMGYKQIDEDCSQWDGAKLNCIYDSLYSEDHEDDIEVIVVPYIDLYEHENGYLCHDGYIYLGPTKPSNYRKVVYMCNADGYDAD